MAFTYFFRDLQSLELSIDLLIPKTMGKSKIKLWDAGCASGQEPYSLAILLAEKMGEFSFRNVEITSTDIDISNQFEKIIQEGIYSKGDLIRIPDNLFRKYFNLYSEKDQYQILEKIRKRLKYIRHDLLSLIPPDTGFSLIVCKNVLLHFNESQRISVLKMFHSTLCGEGLLVMEHTQKLPDTLNHLFVPAYPNAQVYRKK